MNSAQPSFADPVARPDVGGRLKLAREAVGMSQAYVAAQLGLPRHMIRRIETRRRKVTSLQLERLAHLYSRSTSEFFAPTFDLCSPFIGIRR